MRIVLISMLLIAGGYAIAITTIAIWLGHFDIAAATTAIGVACFYCSLLTYRT